MSSVKMGSGPSAPEHLATPWPRRTNVRERLRRALLGAFVARLGDPPIRFVCADTEVGPGDGSEIATVVIGDGVRLTRLIANPELEFGRAYSDGRIEVQGDLISLSRLVHRFPKPTGLWKLARALLTRRPRANTLRESKENIHRHYDLGNDFYALWLDPELLYTCAYYERPGMTLEQAQLAKMEHVCRKLQLQPGQRVVEAGGGWGSLALYMARRYGTRVTSYNISEQQVALARERARREGLADRVEFLHDDYRNIEGEFDAFVSVGMLEHVGRKYHRAFGAIVRRSLKPGGLAFIHTIGRNRPQPLNPWIERTIFPGACPPSIGEMMGLFETNDLSVLDVENLRLHYALTLRQWLQNFEDHADTVEARFGQHFTRAWRLYLSGSVAAFEEGSMQLFQVLVQRANSSQVPRSRRHLYEPQGSAQWLQAPLLPTELVATGTASEHG